MIWLVSYALISAALGAVLFACSNVETPASPITNTTPVQSTRALALRASDWETITTAATFPLNNDATGHLVFEFPISGSISYLYNVRPPKEIRGSISVSIQVTTTGFVVFNYMTEPFNTCTTAATARPFLWANRNSGAEFDRWWSNPVALTLAPGSATIVVRLAPEHWSSVNGKFGNADAASQAGFINAIRNVSRLGLTFGGGCFFGHGVNVQGGNAQFVLVDYEIQ